MVARDSLGRQGTPFDLDIERGRIHEFAHAVNSAHPAHFRADGAVIPPTFLTTTFHWRNWTEGADTWDTVQMSQERGVHAEQEYVFHGPPPKAGDRLSCVSRIDGLWDKQRRNGKWLTFVRQVTTFTDRDTGRLVAEGILTGAEHQLFPPPDPRDADDDADEREVEVLEPYSGDVPEPVTLGPLTVTDFVRYQGASGDMNPVHHDHHFATEAGLQAPLAIGMFSAGALTSWATDWLGPENVRRTRIRWAKPLFPGDQLILHGSVARRVQDGDEVHLEVALTGTDPLGNVAVHCWMTFVEAS